MKQKVDYKIYNLIADSAEPITNALKRFSAAAKRTKCWAHVSRNIDIY